MCMLGLAFIVANSLITNNLEEKTYENAMLRTLGWDKSNIVLVTLIQTTIYFIMIKAKDKKTKNTLNIYAFFFFFLGLE